MNRYLQRDVEFPGSAAAFLPPAMVEETGWDILLALHSNRREDLDLEKLAAIVSVRRNAIGRWLSLLEDRRLVTGSADAATGELRALLTADGRDLIDRYLSAVVVLQSRTDH